MGLEKQLLDYCIFNKLEVSDTEIECLDYIISDTERMIGVMVRDWNRSLGFNIVIVAEQIKKRYKELNEVIILTNAVSDPAQTLAEKIGIPIYRHWELSRQTKIR